MAVSSFSGGGGATGGLQPYEQWFTSSGTWTKPKGVKTVEAIVVGGSGGSTNTNGCSGAGGYIKRTIDVSALDSVPVTVGAGGSAGGAGSSSSFGTMVAFGSAGSTGSSMNQGDACEDTSIPGLDTISVGLDDYTVASGSSLDSSYPQFFQYNNRTFAVSGGDQTVTYTYLWELDTVAKTTTQLSFSSGLNYAYGYNQQVHIGNGICLISNNSGSVVIISFDGGDTWDTYNIWTLLSISNSTVPRIVFEDGYFYIATSTGRDYIYKTADLVNVTQITNGKAGSTSRFTRALGVANGGQNILEIWDNGNVSSATVSQSTDGGATWLVTNISGNGVNPAYSYGLLGKVYWNPNFNEWFWTMWHGFNTGGTTSVNFYSVALSLTNSIQAGGSFNISTYTTLYNWSSMLSTSYDPAANTFYVFQGSNPSNQNGRKNSFFMGIYRAPASNALVWENYGAPVWGFYDQTLSCWGYNTSYHDKINEWASIKLISGNKSYNAQRVSAGAGGSPQRTDATYWIPGPGIDGLANGCPGEATANVGYGYGVCANSLTGTTSAAPGNQGVVIVRWWA